MAGLNDFVRKRLKDLHDNAESVGRVANRVVIRPVVHAGGNIVNAGATAARDIGGATQATGRFVMATPDHNVVLPAVQNAAKSTVRHFAVDLPKSAYDIGRGAVASATGNQVALRHANEAKMKDEGAFLQPVARPVAQIVRTVEHPFAPNSYQAHGRDARVIFGDAPVQNVAAGVKSTYGEHPNLPMPQRLLLSGAYGAGQIAQDAATLMGAKVASKTLVKGAAETGAKALNTTKEIATNKPFRAISDSELAAANRVSMRRSGYPDNTKPGDIETYRAVQRKLGVGPNDHSAIDNVIGARMTYDTRMSQRPKFLSAEGGGRNTQYHGKGRLPHENFEHEYAAALKEMDSGLTGGQMIPDGEGGYVRTSEHSPFYRKVYVETGKPPTKEAWLKESQRQLRSGRADSYAQEEYEGLKAQAAKPTTPVKSDALKRSTKEDAPTAISDALLAKNEKLQAARGQKTAVVPAGGETPVIGAPVLPEGKLRQNRFTKGAKDNRQNLSEPVVEAVAGQHAVRNTQGLQDAAVANADVAGIDQTIADAHKALQVPTGKITDKDVALTQQAIERADAAGRTEDAVNLHDQLSEHLTKQGQSIQAASLFYNLSPQGQLYKAMRDIKRGGGEVTPKLEANLRKQTDDIASMPDGDAKDMARAKFKKTVREAIPQSKLKSALSVWKAGLLSGAKTQTGNFLSNATFATLKKVSDAPAAALDHVLSLFTKERTKTFTLRGSAQGTAEGTKKGYGTLRTGIDSRDIGNGGKLDVHGELNFKSPVIQKVFGTPSNLVFRGMNAADQPFYFAAAKNNLYDMALAEAKTRKLKGAEADAFVKNTVANPTREMAERAKLSAQKAVLGQDSKLAASLTHLAQEHPSFQVLAPFIKVPTNFLTRSLDYTPVGAVKAAVKAMADKRGGRGFDQRAFVEAIGEATTGSAVLYLGAEMAANKLLSGSYPTDPKEQARWKAQGITPNSIHIGNKWISLNYLGPLGLLLGAGKSYHDAAAEGNNGWTQALASFGKNLAGQSFLSGFNSFANALNDPSRYLSSLKNSEAGSLIPAWANDLANIFDSHQRQASTVPETIQSRILGARNQLPEKTDVYGNRLQQRVGSSTAGRIDQAADPLRPSLDTGKNNPVIKEVARLHNVDPNNADLQVTPTPPTSINIEGKTIKLSADQKYELQNKVGSAVQKKWGTLIKTPEYKALDDAGKAKALSNLRSDVTTLTERQYVIDKNLGTYQKAPSRSVQALGQDQAQIGDYATKTQQSGSSGIVLNKKLDSGSRLLLTKYNAMSSKQREDTSYSQNDFDYKVAKAKFDNDVANGSLSKAGRIKAQAAVDKAAVGAKYSRDVRDLYGLSNDALSEWLATSEAKVDKKALADKIIAYGDALAAAGVVTKNKFRNTAGAVTLGQTKKTGGHTKVKTASIPGIKNNPYKGGGSKGKPYKQVALPKLRDNQARRATYKTVRLSTNINSKLRKA